MTRYTDIKFRAIIKTPDGKIKEYPCGVYEGGVFISTNIPYYGGAYVPLREDYGQLIALRRYAGLNDINNKEIYTGDVVECFTSGPSVVEFRGGSFGLANKVEGFVPFNQIHGDVTVIGNIYDHPHLIEDDANDKNRFRGKRVDTGKWVYGYLVGKDVIVGEIVEFCEEYFNTEFWWRIDPRTVGRYIGFKDKNGDELYTGDVLEEVHEGESLLLVVKWDEESAMIVFEDINGTVSYPADDIRLDRCEVIGNIHDNPNLIKTRMVKNL